MKHWFKNQSGFTMIESMIAGALILGAILLMSKGFKDQMGNFNEKEKTLFSKQIAYEMISNALNSSKDLPPFYFEDKPLTNIRCFDFKGVPLGKEVNLLVPDDKKEKPSGNCTTEETGAGRKTYVEIQQWWVSAGTLVVFGLIYDKDGAVTEQFKMSTEIPSAF